ncbi:MAG: glycosyltransferase family A protein [Bacteroidota bacterium]
MKPLDIGDKPLISIILPTFNRAAHLQPCIESVVNQTFPSWELLVIDDGSTDHTFQVVDAFLQADRRIRYCKHQNRKQMLSRNVGIQLSLGEYLTFLDSDDAYAPNHLETCLHFMQTHPKIDLMHCGIKLEEDVWFADYYQSGQLIHLKDCVITPGFFGKREVFFALEGFQNLSYGEDTDLWERAGKRFNVQKIASPETYIYTRASESFSKKAADALATQPKQH